MITPIVAYSHGPISTLFPYPHINVPIRLVEPGRPVPDYMYQFEVLWQGEGEDACVAGGTCGRHAIKNALFGLSMLDWYDQMIVQPHNKRARDSFSGHARGITELTPATQTLLQHIDTCIAEYRIRVLGKSPEKAFGDTSTWEGVYWEGTWNAHGKMVNKLTEQSEVQNIFDVLPSFLENYNKSGAARGQEITGINGTRLTRINAVELANALKLPPGQRTQETDFKKMDLDQWARRTLSTEFLEQIAAFRTYKDYRHAFLMTIQAGNDVGYGPTDHYIAVIVEKRAGKPFFIIMDSMSNIQPSLMHVHVLQDFARFMIDSAFAPMSEADRIRHVRRFEEKKRSIPVQYREPQRVLAPIPVARPIMPHSDSSVTLQALPAKGLCIFGNEGEDGYMELIQRYTQAFDVHDFETAERTLRCIQDNKQVDARNYKSYVSIFLEKSGFSDVEIVQRFNTLKLMVV